MTAGADVATHVLKVDASGKATFTITADDPDPTDKNNPRMVLPVRILRPQHD